MEVIIDTEDSEIMFGATYLYVGSLAGYTGRYFTDFPFRSEDMGMEAISAQRIFTIPFSEIIY